MLRKIILGVIVLVSGFCVLAATRPAAFHYERSLEMTASPETLFPYVNDVQLFQKWNPFAEEDPGCTITFSGPSGGIGAAAHWSGAKSGEGSMTVIESVPNERVRYRMDFRKPFAATHTAEFTIQAKGGKTVVSWSLSGNNNFLGKAIGLLIDCEKMCGDQFLKGLGSLKSYVERGERGAVSASR